MKTITMNLKVGIIIIVLIVSSFSVKSQNPTNGGFENGSTGWTLTPTGVYTPSVVTTKPRTGSKHLKINYSAGEATSITRNGTVSSTISIQAGQYSHTIGWGKRTGTKGTFSFSVSGAVAETPSASNALTNSYVRYTRKSGSTSTNGGTYQITVRTRSAGADNIYFDDIISYASANGTTDIIKPTAATGLTLTGNSLSWVEGTDANTGVQETYILRTTTASATAPVLSDQVVYAATNTVSDWTVIGTVNFGTTTYTDISGGSSYYYAVVHRDLAYNYSVATFVTPTVTVTPIGTYTYNGNPQGPNAATTTGTGSSFTFSYAGTGNTTYSTSATLPTNAGTYIATATIAANGNYTQASSAATAFSITAATNNNAGGNITDAGLSDVQLANTDITVTSGELVVNTGKTVRSITVNGGAKLTVPTGQTLTLTNLTLKSDTSSTATYKPEGTGALVVTGTTAVEQYLTYTRNYYVSSPVSNAVSPTGYTYYGRNEPGGTETGWTAVSVGAGLTAGKGYIALPASAGVPITFTTQNGGTLNTGNITIPLTYTPAATSGNGFNLIGNPYPSHLSWTYDFTQAKADTIESSIWYRTKVGNGNSGGWSFVTFNPTTAETVPSTVNGGLIPPMQAFWVLAKRSGSIQLTNNMRSHQTGNPLRLPAAKNIERKKLRVQVAKGTRTDEALIVFDANAADGYDAYDSPKIMNDVSDLADIYTVSDAKKLVINGLNSVKYDTEIPLGFSTLTPGDFSISANEISNFDAGTRIVLIDKLNSANEFELTNGVAYNFSAPVTAASTDRFSLILRAPGITTGVDNTTKLNTQVYVNAANQIVIMTPEKSVYTIYNAVGQQIAYGTMRTKLQTINCKLV